MRLSFLDEGYSGDEMKYSVAEYLASRKLQWLPIVKFMSCLRQQLQLLARQSLAFMKSVTLSIPLHFLPNHWLV